jgi:hypothetical protein
MHRIDADGHVANAFSDGDEGLGVPGTKVDAAWLNAAQEEICNLLEELGVTLTKGVNTQLRGAVAPNIAKAWAKVQLGATPTILKSFNIDSVAYEDAGLTLRITWDIAFPDANYAPFPSFQPGATYFPFVYDQQAGSIAIRLIDATASPTPWTAADLSALATTARLSVLAFDQ